LKDRPLAGDGSHANICGIYAITDDHSALLIGLVTKYELPEFFGILGRKHDELPEAMSQSNRNDRPTVTNIQRLMILNNFIDRRPQSTVVP
jgi:hypothetical protein